MDRIEWQHVQNIQSNKYTCGHCGSIVASALGLNGKHRGKMPGAFIHICPDCTGPTLYIPNEEQIPGVRYGNDVEGVTDEGVLRLYNEARDCTASNAHTAAVLCCRKILMHIAVEKGAKESDNFANYVDYLAEQGYVPPGGKSWVDHIRQMGNQANHEIVLSNPNGSAELLSFIEMLLKFIYEFPARVKPADPEGGA